MTTRNEGSYGPSAHAQDSSAPSSALTPDTVGAPASAHLTAPASPPERVWVGSWPGIQAVTVWTERVPGEGEDAEPFVAHHWESGQGLLAVFDGSGGAGAATAWQTPQGTPRTGAWVGARVARLATDCWFRQVATDGEPDGPRSLHEYVEYFLSKAPQRRSKLGGTMRRQLPTTLAALHYRLRDKGRFLELQPLWVGDSRAYTLTPGAGLQVLTRDHTLESDALELLRTDPPMTNLACADRPFEVGSQRLSSYALPCVLVTATDGFFGYVHTPADFEYLLLSTLRDAQDANEWADLLRRRVQSYTADDASLALLALGYHSFAELREHFAVRLSYLTDRYVRTRPRALVGPVRADDGSGRAGGSDENPDGTPRPIGDPASVSAAIRAWQDITWHAYRDGYEAHLPPAPEEFA
ncbi:serine/threonine protein phosphatase [Streptomyces niveus]|uniref:serine/threonine protein phosphatase n=1 Tax=Streptomyces niveus TaxID=193462 RepID=UPI003638CD9E